MVEKISGVGTQPRKPGESEVQRSARVAAEKDAKDGKPMTEEERSREKMERFQRVASRRLESAVKALRNLARCASPAGYIYSEEQAGKVIKLVTKAVTDCVDAFAKKSKAEDMFTL